MYHPFNQQYFGDENLTPVGSLISSMVPSVHEWIVELQRCDGLDAAKLRVVFRLLSSTMAF